VTHTNAKRAATGETVRDPSNADLAGGSIGTSDSSTTDANQQVTMPRIDGAGIPCGVPDVRGTTLPSSICIGAFSQRSM